jgi:hypothetical protein
MYLCVSVPLQITLGVLFIVMLLSFMPDWFGNSHYSVQPHKFSLVYCAHNLIMRIFLIFHAGVSPAFLSQIFLFCPCMMLVGEMDGMTCPCLLVLQGIIRIVFGHEIGQHTPNF